MNIKDIKSARYTSKSENEETICIMLFIYLLGVLHCAYYLCISYIVTCS